MDPAALSPFRDLVELRCGLALDGTAAGTLASALARRMELAGTASPAGYYARLVADPGEFDELVTLLTINETYFFREPAQIDLLVDSLVPRLLAGRPGRPVRILSAGCSTGEEPYSIAIALRERFGEGAGRLAAIAAVDIDHHALAEARRAEFGEFSFRTLSPALRGRHFVRCGPRRWGLGPELRAMVDFHPLNLLSAPYPASLTGFDIVFFRNVSIYFDPATRKAILANLRAAMTETGILVLGASETLANDLGVFRLVEDNGGFYFSSEAASPAPRPAPRRPPPGPRIAATAAPPARPPPPAPAADWPSVLASVRTLLRDKKVPEALGTLRALPPAPPADIRFRLLEGLVRLQLRQFAEAAAIARQAVEEDWWSADAHMLLALAAKWLDDAETAIRSLRVIVYSMPECWPAHYYLGTLLQESDPARARREFAVALRQIDADPDSAGGLWLPLDLPAADIRFLCGHRGAACAPVDVTE